MATLHNYCLMCDNHPVDYATNEGMEYRALIRGELKTLPVRPDRQDDPAFRNWNTYGYRLYCTNSGNDIHPIYPENAIVIAYLGPSSSGKNHLITSIERQFIAAALLQHHHISGQTNLEDGKLWDQLKAEGITSPTSPEWPYQAVSLTVGCHPQKEEREVVLFNTSGEDTATQEYPRTYMGFIPQADVLVYTIPPEALNIEELRDSKQNQTDVVRGILSGLQAIGRHIKDRGPNRERIVILTFTKADRYKRRSDFPQQLLKARPAADVLKRIAAEQIILARFLTRHGGAEIIAAANRNLKARVFFSAVSGAGPDDLNGHNESDVVRDTDPLGVSRSLDPILFALMRENIGTYQ